MHFILFDIDGTLIDSGGAGTESMNLAFKEMFSVDNAFRQVAMAGKTDLQIIGECMRLHGIDISNGTVGEFFRLYAGHLKTRMVNGRGHVKRGIREALEAFTGNNNYVVGLLTGNIEEGARIKLDHFGLSSYFTVGAFGGDAEDRNNLLPIALGKLQSRFSLNLGFDDCVVIGDTPRDVHCARPYGAMSIGVATGPYSSEALSEAGADAIFEDLSDTGRLISVITQNRYKRAGIKATGIPRQ